MPAKRVVDAGDRIGAWVVLALLDEVGSDGQMVTAQCSCGRSPAGPKSVHYLLKQSRHDPPKTCTACRYEHQPFRGGPVAQYVITPGQVFGHLTVIEEIGTATVNGKSVRRATFSCFCGGPSVTLEVSQVASGKRSSCGCRSQTRAGKSWAWKGAGDLSGAQFCWYRQGAEDRGIDFTISIEEAWVVFEQQRGLCALSGVPIVLAKRNPAAKRGNMMFPWTASLDRIDSGMGYVPGNVQWVHKVVNLMKLNFNNEDFIQFCHDIADRHPRPKRIRGQGRLWTALRETRDST